jgi:hypothetical protein
VEVSWADEAICPAVAFICSEAPASEVADRSIVVTVARRLVVAASSARPIWPGSSRLVSMPVRLRSLAASASQTARTWESDRTIRRATTTPRPSATSTPAIRMISDSCG